MYSRITLITALLATLIALPVGAASHSVHCIRDGSRTNCAWSMVQPIDLVLVSWTDPKSQPTPLCLDCGPTNVDLTCTLVRSEGRRAVVQCVGAIEAID